MGGAIPGAQLIQSLANPPENPPATTLLAMMPPVLVEGSMMGPSTMLPSIELNSGVASGALSKVISLSSSFDIISSLGIKSEGLL